MATLYSLALGVLPPVLRRWRAEEFVIVLPPDTHHRAARGFQPGAAVRTEQAAAAPGPS